MIFHGPRIIPSRRITIGHLTAEAIHLAAEAIRLTAEAIRLAAEAIFLGCGGYTHYYLVRL